MVSRIEKERAILTNRLRPAGPFITPRQLPPREAVRTPPSSGRCRQKSADWKDSLIRLQRWHCYSGAAYRRPAAGVQYRSISPDAGSCQLLPNRQFGDLFILAGVRNLSYRLIHAQSGAKSREQEGHALAACPLLELARPSNVRMAEVGLRLAPAFGKARPYVPAAGQLSIVSRSSQPVAHHHALKGLATR